MSSPDSVPASKDVWSGISLVLGGLFLAAMVGAVMKILAEDMSAIQVTWFRFAGYAAVMLPLVLYRFGAQALKPKKPAVQIIRGLTMAFSTTLFVLGVRTVEYADSIAILYAYPFLLTLLAIFFLREKVSWRGWVAISGGFLGVLLVMRPGFSSWNMGMLYIFLCAVIVSVQMLLNRKLGFVSHPLVTSFWGALIASLALSIWLPENWQPINHSSLQLLAALIIFGAISQTMVVYAFSRVAASFLAPFTYFEIVAAVLIGLIVFGTLPDWLSWCGIVFIVMSGIIVAHSSARP